MKKKRYFLVSRVVMYEEVTFKTSSFLSHGSLKSVFLPSCKYPIAYIPIEMTGCFCENSPDHSKCEQYAIILCCVVI